MNRKERVVIAGILVGIFAIMAFDLLTDSREGAAWWHLAAEACVAISSAIGVALVVRGAFDLRHRLDAEKQASTALRVEAEKWREQSKKAIEGLSHAIDEQLSRWALTASEKEIAFLLLKGLSSKEIASLRGTAEKTVRAQCIAIYEKAGLSGRQELLAFFLEDLLVPSVPRS